MNRQGAGNAQGLQEALGPMFAGDVGRQAVLVLEAVATGGAVNALLLRDVMGDEVL